MSDASTARHDIEENPSSIGAWTLRTQLTVPRKLANSSLEFRGLNNFLGRVGVQSFHRLPQSHSRRAETPRVYTRAWWLSSTQDVQPRKREPKELQEASSVEDISSETKTARPRRASGLRRLC